MDVVHYSVLQKEVADYLKPVKPGALMIDCTLGEGGHTELFLKTCPDLRVIGLDADETIMKVAKGRLSGFGDRVRFYNTWFNAFFRTYPLGDERPDLILFDLGISLYHYEKGDRGFSFLREESLDMRLDRGLELSAEDVVNDYPQRELEEIFRTYGEERYARRIARAIVGHRSEERIVTSKQLADVIFHAVPPQYRYGRIHPGTRSFQAIRIVVNGELARLETGLEDALRVLKPGGRMGVISFHSLEDRIVKWFFRDKGRACICPPEEPICKCGGTPVVKILTKRPLVPGEDEIRINPPSRSAKLRVIEKLRDEDS